MTVAIQICGIVALTIVGLLTLFAFLDAHGWFNTILPREEPEYTAPLSTIKSELEYWGVESIRGLNEYVVLNLNQKLRIVDDIGVQHPLTKTQIVKIQEKFGIDERILVEYLQEQGHTCVIIKERE